MAEPPSGCGDEDTQRPQRPDARDGARYVRRIPDISRTVERRFDIDYSRWNGRLMGAIGLGPRFSHVVLGDIDVHVRMGWGFRARVPIADIQRVAAAERPFFAWGVHGWRGRWLVNGSSKGIVALEIDPPVSGWAMCFPLRLRTVYISLADPGGFLHASASDMAPARGQDLIGREDVR